MRLESLRGPKVRWPKTGVEPDRHSRVADLLPCLGIGFSLQNCIEVCHVNFVKAKSLYERPGHRHRLRICRDSAFNGAVLRPPSSDTADNLAMHQVNDGNHAHRLTQLTTWALVLTILFCPTIHEA